MHMFGRSVLATTMVVALLLTGCAVPPGAHGTALPLGTGSMPFSQSPDCTGAAGQFLLTKLFADLSAGNTPDMRYYFTDPAAFDKWADPTPGGDITSDPTDPLGFSLDGLRDHLAGLARGGLSVRLMRFADNGFQRADTIDAGGWFDFDLYGRDSGSGANVQGAGMGAVDCLSGRLKAVVIFSW